ncbi:MAG TPA: hydroxysqualene dehydroxylase HpnE [Pirellulaceae bacterium]|jgi:squalene-associated FAD-dependent desaturase
MSRIAIVGGGLAGMACAAALAGRGLQIELFEARKKLGGRAGSYLDRPTGEAIDHCQHVAMGCCTNYIDFCHRTGIGDLFMRQRTLHFFGPDGQRSDFSPSRWLPAPLHLMRPLLSLRYLSLMERVSISKCMLALIGSPKRDSAGSPTVLDWLKGHGQSERVIDRFWKVILVSALAESLERASLAAARKVFVDGFLANRNAADVLVPTVSLDELYQERVRRRLLENGVQIQFETPIEAVATDENRMTGLQTPGGNVRPFDVVVLAVPWTRISKLLAEPIIKRVDPDGNFSQINGSPISSVHLWFDRPIMELPNAIFVERLSQWIFSRTLNNNGGKYYYQVVISASHDLAGRDKESVIRDVRADISAVFPKSTNAQLVRSKVIVEDQAVFSVRPGLDAIRSPQQTAIPNLMLAGDWTRTGWPATMEGAVRSGYLAAEAVLKEAGKPEPIVVPDLPRNWITRWL